MAKASATFDARAARSIGFVSDSHGFVDPRIVEALSNCDVVVHAGDIGGPDVLDAFASTDVLAIRGNNDTSRHWRTNVPDLAESVIIDSIDGMLVVIHGHQFPNARKRHAQLRARFPEAHAIIYGHSHRRCIDRESEPWVLNPGACGRARTFGGPSAIVMARTAGRWCVQDVRFPPQPRLR